MEKTITWFALLVFWIGLLYGYFVFRQWLFETYPFLKDLCLLLGYDAWTGFEATLG